MKTGPILKTSFAAIILCTILGTYLRINHAGGAMEILVMALVATIVFIVTAVFEVNHSTRIGSSEKVMWTLGFILTSSIAGFFYLISARKRIVAKP